MGTWEAVETDGQWRVREIEEDGNPIMVARIVRDEATARKIAAVGQTNQFNRPILIERKIITDKLKQLKLRLKPLIDEYGDPLGAVSEVSDEQYINILRSQIHLLIGILNEKGGEQ